MKIKCGICCFAFAMVVLLLMMSFIGGLHSFVELVKMEATQ